MKQLEFHLACPLSGTFFDPWSEAPLLQKRFHLPLVNFYNHYFPTMFPGHEKFPLLEQGFRVSLNGIDK
jgi:hypothetical protein